MYSRNTGSPSLAGKPATIIIAVALSTVFTVLLLSYILIQERHSAIERAQEESNNIVMIAEREITRTLQFVDFSLQAVTDNVLDSVVRKLPREYRRQLLFDRATASGQFLGAIMYIDEHGNIVDYSKNTPIPKVNFADRDWFQVHEKQLVSGMYMSKPFYSRLEPGMHCIALSRRVIRSDGSFAGVAIASIKLEYFDSIFKGLEFGRDGSVSLIQEDGVILMRLPKIENLVGSSFADSPVYEHLKTSGETTFFGISATDGLSRQFVFRQFDDYPLTLSVAKSRNAIVDPWWQRTLALSGFMLLLVSTSFAMLYRLSSEFKRRLATERDLRELSEKDGLTGLKNRRTVDQCLDIEWANFKRKNHALSVLFIDIDFFKAYNDTYGHQCGDKALVAVATEIARCALRPRDLAGRYGGEEFILILPDTDSPGAQRLADAINIAVSALAIEHTPSSHGVVTVSIGIATATAQTASVSTLVQSADHALYAAKAAGRNTKIVASS